MVAEPNEPRSAWRAELFGGFRLQCGEREVSRFRTRKTAALLAYLCFFQDRAHSRDLLIDLLWPEVNLDSGRHSLRMALSSLREALGDGAGSILVTDRTHVRLNQVQTDVSDFERGLDSDDVSILEAALRKVKGPLLTGFDDSWIVAQWLRLEESYAQAAVRLMELSLSGDIKGGIRFGREAVALLGPREDVHLALMRLFVADGQPSLAVAQFEELERGLSDQWGESPTQAAYNELAALPKGGRAVKTPSPNKPVVATRVSSFFGREKEIGDLIGLVLKSNNRLTTLTGVGGSGKTALANEVAREIGKTPDNWVYTVELADVRDPERILGFVHQAVAGTSDVAVTTESLSKLLDGKASVLILDNLEQLLPQGALEVKRLLSSMPNCRVLATSRRPLDIDGEQVFPVPPLAVPSVGVGLSHLADIPSVALFADRARSNQPSFVLSPTNASAVAEICRRLEGLPLAIELAAAKVSTYSPAQILANLGGSGEFLASRRADVSDRQRSLKATLDWSLALLDEDHRTTYQSLGVFRGSFSLEGAQEVTGEPQFPAKLETLLRSSLVSSSESPVEPRFRLLEPIREHALSGLSERSLTVLRRRHFEFSLSIARGHGLDAPGPGNKEWLDLLDREHENLCAAFECGLDGTVPPAQAVELALTARPFFRPRGRSAVWRHLLELLKDQMRSSSDVKTKARLWLAHAQMSANMVDYETLRSHHVEAVALCEEAHDKDGLGQAYAGLAGTYKVAGDYPTSIEYYEKAVQAFKETNNAKQLASTIRQLAMSYVSMHDHDMTYEKLKEAVPYAREDGDPDTLAWTLTDLGVEHALHGFLDESKQCFEEAHAICAKTDNSHMRSIVYWQEAETYLRVENPAKSVELHALSVEHALRSNFREGLKWILLSYGCALARAGNEALGARVMSFTEFWRQRENRPLTGDELEILGPAQEIARTALGDKQHEVEVAAGKSAQLDEILELLGQRTGPEPPTQSV